MTCRPLQLSGLMSPTSLGGLWRQLRETQTTQRLFSMRPFSEEREATHRMEPCLLDPRPNSSGSRTTENSQRASDTSNALPLATTSAHASQGAGRTRPNNPGRYETSRGDDYIVPRALLHVPPVLRCTATARHGSAFSFTCPRAYSRVARGPLSPSCAPAQRLLNRTLSFLCSN